jgi:hypothetical protein
MRFIIGFLCGVIGMLAGWFGLAAALIGLLGPDLDGGLAMGAFFNIGPVGGLVGFVAGVLLFRKIGLVRGSASSDTDRADVMPAPAPTRISRPFAVIILLTVAGLAWWAWYELIRSPYLSHGFMTLNLQFRLPPGAALPPDAKDVQIEVTEGHSQALVSLNETGWHGHDGNRPVILASVSLMYKTSPRVVALSLPGVPAETWRLDLSSDPDPTLGYTPWRLSRDSSASRIEMNFQLSADR